MIAYMVKNSKGRLVEGSISNCSLGAQTAAAHTYLDNPTEAFLESWWKARKQEGWEVVAGTFVEDAV
jgi:hypothetical protein